MVYEPVLLSQITFRKDIRSFYFDKVIDDLGCEKSFDGLKEVLELKKLDIGKKI